ncbi:hypothetical protein SLA2020_286640 [Shorea laevis]
MASSVMDLPSDARCSTLASSPVLAPKSMKSLLRRGFLNPLPSVALGLVPPPLVPMARPLVLWILVRLSWRCHWAL